MQNLLYLVLLVWCLLTSCETETVLPADQTFCFTCTEGVWEESSEFPLFGYPKYGYDKTEYQVCDRKNEFTDKKESQKVIYVNGVGYRITRVTYWSCK